MADIDLNNVDVFLDISGGADFGIDELANALTTGIKADVGLGNVVAGVTVGGAVDVGLDDIRLKELAPVEVNAAIKEIPQINTNSTVDLGLDNIRIRELAPIRLEFNFRPIRVHLPLNYSFCIQLFGFKLFEFSLCGEGMVVTEDFVPRASERCE